MPERELIPFEEVFRLNKDRIHALVFKYLGNAAEAEDVTQEAFLRAYRHYASFKREAEVSSWLYRIAINLCNEKHRARKRRTQKTGEFISLDAQRPDSDSGEPALQVADAAQPKPLDTLVQRQLQADIRREISELPEIYSQVIVLKELENLSYEEIGKILDISLNVLGVRLIRAREQLKKKLAKYL